MFTRIILGFVALLFFVAGFETVQVLGGSSKNPYSSYNISGINYGAQQWDREHGKSGGKSYSRRSRRR